MVVFEEYFDLYYLAKFHEGVIAQGHDGQNQRQVLTICMTKQWPNCGSIGHRRHGEPLFFQNI